jgi:hypothetical protein
MKAGETLMTPDFLRTAFLILVVFLVISLRVLFTRAGVPRRQVALINLGLVAWIIATGFLAARGVFQDFASMPPKILLVIAPALIFTLWIALSSRIRPFVERVPAHLVVALQTFRVVMEVILYGLAAQKLLPEILTWKGRNFDILVGATAPLIAYVSVRENLLRKKISIVWNSLGLVILTNVVIHALLSTPTAFQVFFVEPSNTLVGTFPYIWLPTFVVPVAYFLHIVSIRRSLP